MLLKNKHKLLLLSPCSSFRATANASLHDYEHFPDPVRLKHASHDRSLALTDRSIAIRIPRATIVIKCTDSIDFIIGGTVRAAGLAQRTLIQRDNCVSAHQCFMTHVSMLSLLSCSRDSSPRVCLCLTQDLNGLNRHLLSLVARL